MERIFRIFLGACAFAIGCGQPAQLQMVSMYDDAGVAEAAAIATRAHDIGCTIQYDREEMNHMLALDECLGPTRSTCWSGCESTCTSCGEACAGDSTCEKHCLAERDACKTDHCRDVHTRCRSELVTTWLSNKCDGICAPFRACAEKCAQNPSDTCQSKCDAMARPSCNPARCDALLNAPERKTLDPRWRSNNCDRVCSSVWRCAHTQCSASSTCSEPIKMYTTCAARVAGASVCGLTQAQGLCPDQ